MTSDVSKSQTFFVDPISSDRILVEVGFVVDVLTLLLRVSGKLLHDLTTDGTTRGAKRVSALSIMLLIWLDLGKYLYS